MEHTSLSDALISLIPTYGPWIIFGIVALESAGVPLPGETTLVASALLAAATGQISIVVVVLGQRSLVRIISGSLGEFVGPCVDDRVSIDVLDAEQQSDAKT
jgi:membrane protein DedA with SNARE-associated domain